MPEILKNFSLWSNISAITKNHAEFFQKHMPKDHSSLYLAWPLNSHVLYDPSDIQYVLKTNHKNYIKSSTYKFLWPLIGKSLLTADKERWRHLRKIMAPYFIQKNLMKYVPFIYDITDQYLSKLSESETWDAADNDISQCILELALQIFLGKSNQSIKEHIAATLPSILNDMIRRIYSFVTIPLNIPTAHNKSINQMIDRLKNLVEGLLKEKMAQDKQETPFIIDEFTQRLGEDLSFEDARNELITLILAGHETTSNALSWCLYLLALNPQYQETLYQEIQAEKLHLEENFELLNKNLWIERVLWESMRLYSPVPGISRNSIEADTLPTGLKISANQRVELAFYALFRSEKYYERPNDFYPERFTSFKDIKARILNFELLPFSGGPRICIGESLSMMEMKVFLATLIHRYQFSMQEGQKISLHPTLTSKISPQLSLKVRLRN